MERITSCETGQLAPREVEPQPAAGSNSAQAAAIKLSADPPLIQTATVQVLAPARSLPAVEPRVSRTIRLLDLTLAIAILIFVLPLVVLCALAIKASGPGPVIYRQTRIGRSGREFTCLKFRTMVNRADQSLASVLGDNNSREEWANYFKLRQDPRVTPIGRYMRRHSIDELPQLFNVMRGEMSIVGPRPIVAEEIHRYGVRFNDYCSVNPGLTGLWQVSGRHALSYDERVRLDAEYANAKSLGLDLMILWKTVPVVLFGWNE